MKQEKDILITGRTEEDDVKAQKAAARAIEMAFLKKKQLENDEEMKKSEPESVLEESAPIPAKRQSVKKANEEDGGR